MRLGRHSSQAGASLVLVLSLAAALLAAGLPQRRRPPPFDRLAGPADIIDGDSLRIAGTELRLQGIDAPEYRQICHRGGEVEPCGRQARDALVRLVAGRGVACDLVGTDKYGRGLAHCRAGALDINRQMVLSGHAVAFGAYESEEEEARAARRGVWASAFERPADWRARHAPE